MKSEKLIAIHNDEQGAIESQLTTLVPTNYLDACYLLEFATILAEGVCMAEDADVAILKNVRAGLRNAWNNDMQAEHKKATWSSATASARCSKFFTSRATCGSFSIP